MSPRYMPQFCVERLWQHPEAASQSFPYLRNIVVRLVGDSVSKRIGEEHLKVVNSTYSEYGEHHNWQPECRSRGRKGYDNIHTCLHCICVVSLRGHSFLCLNKPWVHSRTEECRKQVAIFIAMTLRFQKCLRYIFSTLAKNEVVKYFTVFLHRKQWLEASLLYSG